MAKVFIAPGHGGSDPGAVGGGFKEKDLNLSISHACRKALERHGVTVLMSRTVDEDETLNQQVSKCNEFDPDLAVNIHNNAGGGDGAEVFCHLGGGKSRLLAEEILREIQELGQNSRGVKVKVGSDGRDWFGFIRMTNAPAVLVECAFLDTEDVEIVDTEAEQKAMGVAVAKGVLRTLGIPWQAEEPRMIHRVQVGAYAQYANAEAVLEKLRELGFKDAFIRSDPA